MNNGSSKYLYFTEGETEKKLVDLLKTDLQVIKPGKSKVFNIFEDRITPALLANISPKTKIVLIFDTDVIKPNFDLYDFNFSKLKKSRMVIDIITIPQCRNFEEEMVYSMNIKKAGQLFAAENDAKFKSTFLRMDNRFLRSKLEENSFDITKLWSRNPNGVFSFIENQARKIKL